MVNRGDSFRRRRSRSNSLAPPALGMDGLTSGEPSPVVSGATTPIAPHAERQRPNTPVTTYRVAILGAAGVGKSALVSQFMTSECINPWYDRQRGN